ncbi:MAG TPA: hypothetical protein PKD64_19240 [Pirellulaceae bacterium]|nr:hypothetical protein [Pirellulaceae bacterium]HMO94326.1 hypothetical protein [Pirellulaceae bacterium]HMP71608.1 hypothetical protein [Pirellulaceae bacterium]
MAEAVSENNLKKVQLLLKAGVPAESPDYNFLAIAASRGNFDVFAALLEAGANINRRDSVGDSLLPSAIRGQSASIVKSVLDHAQLSQNDLDEAFLYPPDNLEIVHMLLAAGAKPEYVSEDGSNCLLYSILFNENEALALLLLDFGAKDDIRVPSNYEDESIGNIYKMRLRDLAALKGMRRLVSAIDHQTEKVTLKQSESSRDYDTITDCWLSIEAAIRLTDPSILFPRPAPVSKLDRLLGNGLPMPIAESLHEMYACLDGTGDIAIFPMSDDVSYTLLDIEKAFLTTSESNSLYSIEYPGLEEDNPWRHDWLVFAENGAGDCLVLNSSGRCLRFSHETCLTSERSPSLLELFREIANGLTSNKFRFIRQSKAVI